MPEDSATWQPDNSLTDTALQILKITNCANTFLNHSSNEFAQAKTLLTEIFVSWLHALDRVDVRAKYAWPHSKEDGVNTFRLENHF